MTINLLKSFIAVVLGNVLYFFVLMPHLPPLAQHRRDRIDFGLIVDFWICVVIWGVVDLIFRKLSAAGRGGVHS